jgi:ketosteroid isomerase-like protein
VADHPNAELVRRVLEAFAAGDTEPLEAAFAEDVVWHAPGTNRFSGRFDGRRAAMHRLARMREEGISTTFDVHDVVANDDHAVALVHIHLETPDGRRYDQPQVQVAHVRGGSVAELWVMNQDQAVLDELIGR